MVRFYTGLIFAFVGMIFCTVSLVMYINTRNFLEGTMAGQGRITSCQMQPVTNSDHTVSYLCQPTVHFTTASGQDVDFVSSVSANTFHEGDEVPVQYHPDHPQDALISSFMGLWFLPLIFGGLGVPFVFIGLWLLIGQLLLVLIRGKR